MKILNKKGFTMVELLAVVTILGVLAIVAIPSTKYLIERGKENYYVAQKNQNLFSQYWQICLSVI